MKRNTILFAVLGVCLTLVLAGCPNVVKISDKGLENAIRAAVDKPFGFLTQDDLLSIRQLDARNRSIRSLAGIELCKNLAWLDLDTNAISDITPLEQLGRPESPFDSPLVYLNLDGNEISDITPLAGLLNLKQLSLFNNQVVDITPLVTNVQAGGMLESVILDSKTLDEQALSVDVPILISYGVQVSGATAATSSSSQ